MSSVVNTNIAALSAQVNMSKSSSMQEQAMERLSSGLRINSAADDAAGSAIASSMESQVRSLGVAIRNGNDAISLTQTAEGALEEIEGSLQRMRELAVQAGNSTLNDSDRAQIQLEIDALTAEVDSIAKNANFNGVALLDGSSSSVKFQAGINASDSLEVNLTKADAAALSLSGASYGTSKLTSERFTLADLQTVENDFVKINGQDAIAADDFGDQSTGSATAVATLINANTAVHGAKATAFNSFTSRAVGDFSMTTSFTINTATIDIVTSYADLVDEINQEATGITAVLNADNTITLSNDDGGAIAFSNAQGASDVGFTTNATATTYEGFITLENVDGSDVRVEAMTKANGYASNTGSIANVNALGFNEVSGTTIEGAAVSSGDLLLSDEVKINGVAIGATLTSDAASKAAAINALTDEHGVTADAETVIKLEIDFANVDITALDAIGVNGTDVDVSSDTSVQDFVTTFNAITGGVGDIVASTDDDGLLVLTSASGANIVVTADTDETDWLNTALDGNDTSLTLSSGDVTAYGNITLSTTGGFIKLEDVSSTNAGLAKLGLQGASAEVQSSGSGVDVSTTDTAANSLNVLDTAIQLVSEYRASFGAYENRLNANISQLTTLQMNTSAALSRIQDADFAAETSALTKQQILNQAATSMLAQANASKQNLLALLQ